MFVRPDMGPGPDLSTVRFLDTYLRPGVSKVSLLFLFLAFLPLVMNKYDIAEKLLKVFQKRVVPTKFDICVLFIDVSSKKTISENNFIQ
jgi:hypothetical protein